MKIIIKILTLCSISILLNAGEISGKIELKDNNQLRTETGEIFVGEVNYKSEFDLTNFPPYLIAMVDAMKNQRKVTIDKDGKFLIKNVPTNKKLVIGISFSGVVFYKNAFIEDNKSLEIKEIISMEQETKKLKVKVENETAKNFKSEFASVSYLVQEGTKGRIFVGNKSKLGVIDFGEVPLGLYKLYVLNEVEEGKPNRVDVMVIEISKEEKKAPLVFKIK